MELDGLVACWCQLGDATWTLAAERIARYPRHLRGQTTGERMILAAAAFDAARRNKPAARAAQLAELALAGGLLLTEQPPDAPNFFLAAWTLVEATASKTPSAATAWRSTTAGVRGSLPGVAIAASCRCPVRFRQRRIAGGTLGVESAAVPTRASAALAHAQLGEHEAAQRLAEDERQRARQRGTPSALSFALRQLASSRETTAKPRCYAKP